MFGFTKGQSIAFVTTATVSCVFLVGWVFYVFYGDQLLQDMRQAGAEKAARLEQQRKEQEAEAKQRRQLLAQQMEQEEEAHREQTQELLTRGPSPFWQAWNLNMLVRGKYRYRVGKALQLA